MMLEHPWSTLIDMWSLGCIVSRCSFLTGWTNFLSGRCSIISRVPGYWTSISQLLLPSTSICSASPSISVSSHPPSLRAVVTVKNISMSKVYIFIYTLCASHKPTDELLRIKEPSPHTLEDRIADYKHLNKADIASAAVFIRRCLTIDASVRPSALELLDDDECLHGV
jgi:serine/threonine-protein kinase SRPK3